MRKLHQVFMSKNQIIEDECRRNKCTIPNHSEILIRTKDERFISPMIPVGIQPTSTYGCVPDLTFKDVRHIQNNDHQALKN